MTTSLRDALAILWALAGMTLFVALVVAIVAVLGGPVGQP
jgi:hypothetical protein